MCSIILRIEETGIFIAANRDEMLNRPWAPPGAYWPKLPGIIAGQDKTAGGTWLGLNRHGVMAALLNRHGSLGPLPGKRSRGELPLLALGHYNALQAAAAIGALDAGNYRSFNVVIADSDQAFFISGLETGAPTISELGYGTWMITSGEPNETGLPRIARHLPRFENAPWETWKKLLGDNSAPIESALDIPAQHGFGTVCASVISLPRGDDPTWEFAAGPPHATTFLPVTLPA